MSKQKPRYFVSMDGEQVVVDKSENPDVSWYEHKAAREVVLADPKDIVIPAKDMPEVIPSEVMAAISAGGCQMSWDDESLERAERYVSAYAAIVRFLREERVQEQKAKAAETKALVVETANVLLAHSMGHIETIDDMEGLSKRLVEAGYKIVKEY